jgi:hypothetical protein
MKSFQKEAYFILTNRSDPDPPWLDETPEERALREDAYTVKFDKEQEEK